jgi:hypothetical protein
VVYAFSNDNKDINALIFDSAGEASSPAGRQLPMLDFGVGAAPLLDKSNIRPAASHGTPRRALTQLLLLAPAHLLRNNVFDRLGVLLRLLCSPAARAPDSPWRGYRLTVLTDSVETARVSLGGVLGGCVEPGPEGGPLVRLVQLRAISDAEGEGQGKAAAEVLHYDKRMLKFRDEILSAHTAVGLEAWMAEWPLTGVSDTDSTADGVRRSTGAAARVSVRELMAFFARFDVLVYRDLGWDLQYYSLVTLNMHPPSPANKLHSEVGVFVAAVHLAWLAGVRTVRYLDISTSNRGELGYYSPADGYMLESSMQLVRESAVRILLGPLRAAKPLVVVPPILPPSSSSPSHTHARRQEEGPGVFRVLFAGGFRSYACPGAFVRVVGGLHRLLRELRSRQAASSAATLCGLIQEDEENWGVNASVCAHLWAAGGYSDAIIVPVAKNSDADADVDLQARADAAGGRVLRVQFTMFGDGHLRDAVTSLMRAMDVEHLIHVVVPPEEGQIIDSAGEGGAAPGVSAHDCMLESVLRSSDLLVEPCATHSGSAFVLPLALKSRVPVALYSTCGSKEWLPSDFAAGKSPAVLLVPSVSIQAMAGRVLGAALSGLRGGGAALDWAAEGTERVFAEDSIGSVYLQLFEELMAPGAHNAGAVGGGDHDFVKDVSLPLSVLRSPGLEALAESPRRYYPNRLGPRLALESEPVAASVSTAAEWLQLQREVGKFYRAWSGRCQGGSAAAVGSTAGDVGVGVGVGAADAMLGLCSDGGGRDEAGAALSAVERLVAEHLTVAPVQEQKHTATAAAVSVTGETAPGVQSSSSSSSREHRARVLCAVFTTSEEGGGLTPHRDLARTQLSTWGKRCDGFVAYSNSTDWGWNALRVELPQQRGEHYHNMWQKVRAIWTSIHDNFAAPPPPLAAAADGADPADVAGFDWFLMGGDDLYVVVENLRELIAEAEAGVDIDGGEEGLFYLGRPLRSSKQLLYNTGGAGYMLSRAALRRLAPYLRPLDGAEPETAAGASDWESGGAGSHMCFPYENKSVEDVFMGYCLAELGIFTANTADARGRERFHWQAPETEYLAQDRYYMQQSSQEHFGAPVRRQLDCCSDRSVTFQNLKPAVKMANFHAFLYN